MFGRRLSTFTVLRLALTAVLAGGAVSLSTLPSAAASDKVLARVRGGVEYSLDGTGAKTIYTRLVVPDDATAVTGPKSLATLTMPDSSEIDIGERTTVKIGAFNGISSGKDNQITLNNGALHFIIRHPAGQNANYKFETPTSQIAIRGTEGFIIQNAGGTQLSITSGTATLTSAATGVTVAVPAGTTGVVSASGAATVSTTTSTLSVSSISGTTSATSATASAGVAGAGGSAIGSAAAIAGGAAAAAGVVVAATTSNNNNGSSPAPQQSPSSGGTPGPFIFDGGALPPSENEVYATYPQPIMSQTVTQANCTGNATITISGPATLSTTTLPCTGGSINASFGGEFTGTGAALFTITGSGVTETHTVNLYGPITVTTTGSYATTTTGTEDTFAVGAISVTTVPQTIPVSISQPGPTTGTFTSTLNCSNVSSAANYNSFIGLGSVGTFTSSAAAYSIAISAAPSYPAGTTAPSAPYACLLTIQGFSKDGLTGSGFDSDPSEVQLQISVTTATVGIQDRRRLETSPGQRRIPSK